MRKLVRIMLIVAIIAPLISAGLIYVGVQADLGREAETSVVAEETTIFVDDLSVTVSGTGAILPSREVPLLFELTAPVVEVLVKAGDTVQAGDVIARLDATDFDASVEEAEIAVQFQEIALQALTAPPRDVDIAAAEAAVNVAQASYNAALSTGTSPQQVEIARLQAELSRNQLWQTQLQRDGGHIILPELPPDLPPEITDLINRTVDQLNAQNAAQFLTPLEQLEYGIQISDANAEAAASRGPDLGSLNGANSGRVQAQIALDNLLAGAGDSQLQRAQIDLDQAQLALERAHAARDAAVLTAPFAGVIAQNNLLVGQFPPGGLPAVLLVDTSAYFIDLAIDEIDVLQIQAGQPVEIALDALPEAEITGIVERVSLTPTRLGELVTYVVRVKLDPTDALIRMGMTATARITTQQVNAAPLLLNRFIRLDRATGRAFVTVETADGQYEEIQVTLGARNETYSQIISGLTDGQRILLLPRNAQVAP